MWLHMEVGGTSKFRTIGNFYSQTFMGAISGWGGTLNEGGAISGYVLSHTQSGKALSLNFKNKLGRFELPPTRR